MLFNSFIFLIFLCLILPVYFLLRGHRSKSVFLLICSYFFYGYWDYRFCSLLLISTVVDFIVGGQLGQAKDPKTRKKWLLLSVFVNLGILGLFKYFNFFISSFNELAASVGVQLDFLHLNLLLPVGISFYTFQSLSYTIDIYRKKIKPTKNLIDFALFVSFFPQLVAGPIERARHLLPQIHNLKNPSKIEIKEGVTLIITGLFKKVMLGDTAGRIVDHIFAEPGFYKSDELLFGLILFSIQIYADFSGYSNIARGVGKLLGVDLMRNFEQPYLSMNITEFWRRWHISLSTWLRDYLYISIGGNRKGKFRTYFNIMVTMLLGGLWHGASWTFVIWGGLHGIYLVTHKLILGNCKPDTEYHYSGINSLALYLSKVLSTFSLVLIAWLFFRASSLPEAIDILTRIFCWTPGEYTVRLFCICITFMMVMLIMDGLEYFTKSHVYLLKLLSPPAQLAVLSSLLIVTLLFMFQSEPLPFVYFQF